MRSLISIIGFVLPIGIYTRCALAVPAEIRFTEHFQNSFAAGMLLILLALALIAKGIEAKPEPAR